MAQQPQSRLRRFLPTLFGRVLLLLLAIALTFATYAYVSPFIAIPAVLLFGLAVPIWSGIKRPRYLAAAGLVIVLVVAPLATVVFTQEVMTPVGVSQSATGALFSNGGPVMQNASVSPFTGTTSTTFNWTVTIFPANHPLGNTTPYELQLFISTCPGATGNNSPFCSAPYPLTILTKSLPNQTQPYTRSFTYQIGSVGIWAWQMGIYTNNTTTHVSYFQLLVGDPTYNGIEGPVIGGFGTIYTELLPEFYFQELLLLGAPYFCILLVYMIFKNRERRRRDAQQRAPGSVPSDEGGATKSASDSQGTPLPSTKSGKTTTPSASPSSAAELNCPKCNAVVYAGETTCWKCGASLGATGATAPP